MSTLKSIGACVAGFATGAVPAVVTDFVLEKAGIMKTDPFDANPTWLIAVIVLYRSVYSVAGSYVVAKLAPHHPMRHVLILATIGFLLTLAGTIVMWHLPPHWYPISLIILTYPCAWLGGKLAEPKISISPN